jgi:hypothetical protein
MSLEKQLIMRHLVLNGLAIPEKIIIVVIHSLGGSLILPSSKCAMSGYHTFKVAATTFEVNIFVVVIYLFDFFLHFYFSHLKLFAYLCMQLPVQYQLIKPIGSGAYGVVISADDTVSPHYYSLHLLSLLS